MKMQPAVFLRLAVACSIVTISTDAIAAAQQVAPAVLYVFDGSRPGERLGWSVSNPGDLDGDGVPDILAGGPGDFINGAFPGIVRAYSGRDGTVLYTVSGMTNADGFGMALAALPDIDGDGRPDFGVGAPYDDANGIDSGSVYVFSGASGALLNVSHGAAAGDAYGWSICDGHDFDHNSVPDLVVGAPLVDGVGPDSGRVSLVDPLASSVLSSINGGIAFAELGYCVSAARKGINVFVFTGAPGQLNLSGGSGLFYYWANNSPAAIIVDPLAGYNGNLVTSGLNLAAFANNNNPSLPGVACEVRIGAVAVAMVYNCDFSGGPLLQCGQPLQSWVAPAICLGVESSSPRSDYLLVGATAVGVPPTFALRTGACGAGPHQPIDPAANMSRAWAISSEGDLNGDSIFDFAVGDPFVAQSGLDSGRVAVFLNQDVLYPPFVYCSAKVNSHGCTPHVGFEGAPTVSVGDNFRVTASNILNNKPGILIWAINSNSLPFGGGTLCIGPLLHRTSFQTSGGNAPPLDCSGSYSFHFSHAFLASQGLNPGQTVYSQYYSRDPGFPSPTDIGLTDAVRFTVLP